MLRKVESQMARLKIPGLSPDTPSAELPLGGVTAKYWLDLDRHPALEIAAV